MKEEISDILVKFTEDILNYILDNGNIEKKVTVSPTTKKIIVYVDVPKDQRGRIIGKGGMTVEAIKVLAIGIKNSKFPDDKRKVEIEIVEPENFLAQNK